MRRRWVGAAWNYVTPWPRPRDYRCRSKTRVEPAHLLNYGWLEARLPVRIILFLSAFRTAWASAWSSMANWSEDTITSPENSDMFRSVSMAHVACVVRRGAGKHMFPTLLPSPVILGGICPNSVQTVYMMPNIVPSQYWT